MEFHQNAKFSGTGVQSQFSAQPAASNLTERKSSIATTNGGFIGSPQDWQNVGLDAKHVEDGLSDITMTPNSAMNTPHFKQESHWSADRSHAPFTHASEFEPMMGDYPMQNGSGNIGMQYTTAGSSDQSSGAGTAMISGISSSSQYAMPQQQNWVSGQANDTFEFSPLAPQGARHTPVFATSTSILRRDGIRKKNARFEIPAERNLRTIDSLIAQTNDEQEIKELKQQKRLLRNRQAALDSRQRKKQHTERLEEEKKQYTTLLNDMDEEINAMKIREAEWVHQRDELLQNNSNLHQWCQQLQAEKEESLRLHTIEAGQLRKENSLLLEQLQRMEAIHMNGSMSSGLPTDFTDFEQLTIQGSPWEAFSTQNGFGLESSTVGENPSINLPKPQRLTNEDENKSPAAGLLLMLILCGAWVVSKGSIADTTLLSSVPDDLRAASNSVIQGLYHDSGIEPPEVTTLNTVQPNADTKDPTLGVDICINSIDTRQIQGLATGTVSRRKLQNFQRGAFTSEIAQGNDVPSANSKRFNKILRDAMRSAQAIQNPQALPTESITKSLLMDKVPDQVLKDFAEMISRNRASKQEASLVDQDQDQDQPLYD